MNPELLASKKIVFIYHYPCPDGAVSALCAQLGMNEANVEEDRIRWIPATVFEPHEIVYEKLPSVEESKDMIVFTLDYGGDAKGKFLEKLSCLFERVIVLDHHKTTFDARDALKDKSVGENVDFSNVVMDKCGARIALEYFKVKADEYLHRLVNYIEDQDLFKKELPQTNEFSAAFHDLHLEFDINKNEGLISRGKVLVAVREREIRAEIERSYIVRVKSADGKKCRCVQTERPDLRSDLGNRLASMSEKEGNEPMAAVCYKEEAIGKTNIKVSLRSLGDLDTTEISKKYNGGGHKNASSSVMSDSTFRSDFERV